MLLLFCLQTEGLIQQRRTKRRINKRLIKSTNNADFVIGLHGASFANISFCRKNTKVIEFRMEKTGKVIENLANQNDLVFDSIVYKVETPDYDKQSGNIKVSISELNKKINEI